MTQQQIIRKLQEVSNGLELHISKLNSNELMKKALSEDLEQLRRVTEDIKTRSN
ncbi:hypothetical protein [Paenibacillus senegalensis]|uniref:hypothetical protein n=1 Tax=Paenibacillus senegalensis TaxID=1465766 RepID=UPI00031E61FE|nr:hypothetical protein [Paenibacillus senegalensis]